MANESNNLKHSERIYLLDHLKNSSHQVRYLLTNVHLNEKPAVKTEDKAIFYLLQVVVIDQQARLWFISPECTFTHPTPALVPQVGQERTCWMGEDRLQTGQCGYCMVLTDLVKDAPLWACLPSWLRGQVLGCAYSHMSCSDPEVKERLSLIHFYFL